MPVIDDGTRAIDSESVSGCYKTDMIQPAPAALMYLLMVMLKGVGKSQSPNFLWDDPGGRDDFYKKLVDAMGQ